MNRSFPYIFLILFFLLNMQCGITQTLQILDFSSGKPVEGVALFNKERTRSVISDQKGLAKIDHFQKTDSIFFQHPSYRMVSFLKEELEKTGYTVYLNRQIRMLEEYVISVSKWEQNKREVPNKIKTLSAREIRFSNPQTSADLIGISNEIFIQKSQLGGGSPMVRGFSANSVLLVVDGVRMNNAIYRSGNLQNIISLDANTIEQSEVIFGPGSVVYGSDALGGVMDFHTKIATLSTHENAELTANVLDRYSSANKERTTHIDFNVGGAKWAVMSSFTFSAYDDLKMGSRKHPEYQRPEYVIFWNSMDTVITNPNSNIQKNSGYNQINLIEKVRYRPNDNLDMIYAFHYSSLSDVPRYDRLIEYKGENLKYGEWYYGPQKWMMHSLDIRFNKNSRLFDEGKIILSYQDYEESRHDRKFGEAYRRNKTEQVDVLSLNMDFDRNFKKENYIFYGIEANTDKIRSTAFTNHIYSDTITSTGTRYPDGKNNYSSLAAYISYKNNISDLLTFNTGIRYSHIFLHSTISDTSFYHFPFDEIDLNTGAVNGSIGFVFRPNDSWQINLNAASGFRAPNLDDVAKIFDSEPGNVVVPNKDLDPEYAYNIDLGTVIDLGTKGYFEMTGFITLLRNAMVRREFLFNGMDSILYDSELSKVYAVVNADRAMIYGGNVTFRIDLTKNFTFSNTLTFTYGEDQDEIPLRHIPPLFGSTHILFKTKKLNIDFFANYNSEKSFANLAPSEHSKLHMYAPDKNGNPYSPKWFTLNMKADYRLGEHIQINAGIENILDHRYRPYSSGIVSPGRNFILSLRILV